MYKFHSLVQLSTIAHWLLHQISKFMAYRLNVQLCVYSLYCTKINLRCFYCVLLHILILKSFFARAIITHQAQSGLLKEMPGKKRLDRGRYLHRHGFDSSQQFNELTWSVFPLKTEVLNLFRLIIIYSFFSFPFKRKLLLFLVF